MSPFKTQLWLVVASLFMSAQGDARTLHIRVTERYHAQALWRGQTYRCVVGKGGVITQDLKRDHDHKTPLGRFPIQPLFYYRADRLKGMSDLFKQVACDFKVLKPSAAWCIDPMSTFYNQYLELHDNMLIEQGRQRLVDRLYREDGLYDLVIPIAYNRTPSRPGHGAGLFLHVAPPWFDGTPNGSIGLALPDLITIARELAPGDTINIQKAY